MKHLYSNKEKDNKFNLYVDDNNCLYRRYPKSEFYYPVVHKNRDYIEVTKAFPGIKVSTNQPIVCVCGNVEFIITYGNYSVIAKCSKCTTQEEIYSG